MFFNLEHFGQAVRISNERNILDEQLSANIREIPKFYDAKSEILIAK